MFFSENENLRKIHMRYVVVHFINTIQE